MYGEMVSERGDKVPVVSGILVLLSHFGPVQVGHLPVQLGHLPVQDAGQKIKVVTPAVIFSEY